MIKEVINNKCAYLYGVRTIPITLIISTILVIIPTQAKTITVKPCEKQYCNEYNQNNNNNNGYLQNIINNAQDGDVITLYPGRYYGNIYINKTVTLTAKEPRKANIIGTKKGSTLVIDADNVTVELLNITGSGLDLSTQDSGVFVKKGKKNTLIQNNLIQDNLIGVYLWGSIASKVQNNHIIGQKFHRINERGNGVQLWSSPGSIVNNNVIEYGRDGIFTTTSKNNSFNNNYFRNLRYAIHYMYTQNSIVENNYSEQNDIGYALMFSDNLTVLNNISISDREHAFFMNFINDSRLDSNIAIGPSEKCLMMYNANYNHIEKNYFNHCHIGIHYTAGSQDNQITKNSFMQNYTQVKYIGTTDLEFSYQGYGNFWMNHTIYDLNKDGLSDLVYRPNDISDQMLWKNHHAKVLLNSPVIQILKLSQSYFPTMLPGGIRDSFAITKPIINITKSVHRPYPFNYASTLDSNLIETNKYPKNMKNQ